MHCYCKKKKQKKKQRAGLGLEIPVMYQAKWKHEKALKWLEKAIEKMLLQADEIASQFKSERFFKKYTFPLIEVRLDIGTITSGSLADDWRWPLLGSFPMRFWP